MLQILRQILRRFVAVVVSSAFWKSLDDHPGTGSDSSSRQTDDAHPRVGIDNSRLGADEPGTGLSKFDRPLGVDLHEPIEVDELIEVDDADLNAFEGECAQGWGIGTHQSFRKRQFEEQSN